MYNLHRNKISLTILLLLCLQSFVTVAQDKFKVVLDAGHGGKDYGTVHHGFIEKQIALDVTLRVGKLLERYNEIEIIYTRKTDIAVDLIDRPKIANKAKANLYVSIHCNGVKSHEPFGTETFVMGLTRNAANLEVAKKENSVIMLEADYKLKYAGFDPNAPETHLGLKIIQEENLEQSISLASKIQDGFTNNLKRKNRGVKQAPLWVLDQTYMPGVLIELGFLSNKSEGAYVSSEKGRQELAEQIAQAIINYKKEYYGGAITPQENQVIETPVQTVISTDPEKNIENHSSVTTIDEGSNAVVYKVQLAASGQNLDLVPANFKGLTAISKIFENNLYKYYYGAFSDIQSAQTAVSEAKSKGYTTAYIVPFKNGKKISMQEAQKP